MPSGKVGMEMGFQVLVEKDFSLLSSMSSVLPFIPWSRFPLGLFVKFTFWTRSSDSHSIVSRSTLTVMDGYRISIPTSTVTETLSLKQLLSSFPYHVLPFLDISFYSLCFFARFLKSVDSINSLDCKRLSWNEGHCLWWFLMEIPHNAGLLSM